MAPAKKTTQPSLGHDFELIITEKPSSAKKLAAALSDSKPILGKDKSGVTYHIITHNKKDIVVACAVGHLYGLAEKNKKGWTYPVFEVEWVPAGTDKKSSYSTKYLTAIKRLAKEAKSFTVATDYDIEGEVIGLNIVKYACKQKDAQRMKFSTVTKDDLIKSYADKQKTLDWGQANAGETRHILDWIYGINLSRALSLSIKHATGRFKILSSGRVQGPALKILVDKEREISAFVPEPYWEVELQGTADAGELTALHKEDKIFDKKRADEIVAKTKGKDGKIAEVTAKQFKQAPPTPFDLTSLQLEAHKALGFAPKRTLEIAQILYTDGLISYPRTSSQQLPKEIGYEKILQALTKNDDFAKDASDLLRQKKGKLAPNNGKKTDPAHPAIYPTGEVARLAGQDKSLYELIVRRFLATFSDTATRETVKIEIDIENEPFITKGTRTVDPGWHIMYGRFAQFKDEEMPPVKKGDAVKQKDLIQHAKETQPPKRYTQASIIKELEKQNLGTKATRAQIIDNLYQRGYVTEKSMEVTNLGMRTCATLEKYCPEILDSELTRDIELEMEEIRDRKKTGEQVIDRAKKELTKILDNFKKKEKDIGKELSEANIETQKEISYVGECPACKKGNLEVRKGKYGQFIACDKYPDCKTTFSLPAANVKPTREKCEECGFPTLMVFKGKIPRKLCINPDCKTKAIEDEEQQKEADAIGHGEKKPCPKCKKGNLVVRNSIYGKFIACDQYPKCKYVEKTKKDDEHM